MRQLILFLCLSPLFAGDKAIVKDLNAKLVAMTARALSAELRAAVAEERLASIPHQQASERTAVAFKASCENVGIQVEKCLPDMVTFMVHAKPEVPKLPEKPKDGR